MSCVSHLKEIMMVSKIKKLFTLTDGYPKFTDMHKATIELRFKLIKVIPIRVHNDPLILLLSATKEKRVTLVAWFTDFSEQRNPIYIGFRILALPLYVYVYLAHIN